MLRIAATTPGNWWGQAGHSTILLLPAAFFEELFIRGYVFAVLRRAAGWKTALIVTSIVFGLLHVTNPGADAESILAVIVAGFFLGVVFLATRSIYAAGAAHFAWNWVSRFLLGLAFVATQTYATFFLIDTIGLPIADAAAEYARITVISTPVAVVVFLLSGYLSDRFGRRKAFVVVGAVVLAVALVIAAATQTVGGFLVAWVVLTVGQAIYLTVDIVIAAAVVPDDTQAGKAMSVYQVATLLPNVGAPIVAIAVLAISGGTNYVAFFVVLAVVALLAALTILPIRRIR